MIKSILKKLDYVDQIVSGILLSAVIVLVIINVFLRYCIGTIFNWGEELATYGFIFSVYIGASYCYRKDRHIGIDMIYNLFPKLVQKTIDILTDLVLTVLNAGITYLAVVMAMGSEGKTSFILRIPYLYLDSCLVVAFGLMTIYGALKLVSRFTAKKDHAEKDFVIEPKNNYPEL